MLKQTLKNLACIREKLEADFVEISYGTKRNIFYISFKDGAYNYAKKFTEESIETISAENLEKELEEIIQDFKKEKERFFKRNA